VGWTAARRIQLDEFKQHMPHTPVTPPVSHLSPLPPNPFLSPPKPAAANAPKIPQGKLPVALPPSHPPWLGAPHGDEYWRHHPPVDPSPGDFWSCKVTLTWTRQVKEFLGEHAAACAAALDTIRSYTSVTFGCSAPQLGPSDRALFQIIQNQGNASQLTHPPDGACVTLPASLFPPNTPPLDRTVPDFNHQWVPGAYTVQAGLVLGRTPVIGLYRHPRAGLGSCAPFTLSPISNTGTTDAGGNPIWDCSRGMFNGGPGGSHTCR
jgi:hypothetical protein